ncbi:MAG: translation initiation factor IF-2 [Firmicutes bacterium]|nr:translation initiation factor IF-2 [Bacillota bacterium]
MPNNNNETKIVKGSGSRSASKDTNASKVQIRAVDKAIIEAQQKKSRQASAPKSTEQKTETAARPVPMGRPLPKSESRQSGPKPTPFGTPMKKNSVPQNAVPRKKSETPQDLEQDKPRTAAEQAPAAEAVNEAPAAEVKAAAEAPVKEAPAAEKPEVKEEKPAAKAEEPAPAKEVKKVEPEAVKAEPEKASEKPEDTKKAEAAPSEKPEAKAEKPAEKKEEAKAHPEAPKPAAEPVKAEPKEEAPNAEAPKKEEPAPAPVIDYVPNIGVKIIRRAADEPKEEPKPQPSRSGRDQGRKGGQSGSDRRGQGAGSGDRRGAKPGQGQQSGRGQGAGSNDRRGAKPGQGQTGRDGKPYQGGQGGRKPAGKTDGSREKVVAYTAPADDGRRGGRKDSGKKGADRNKDKRDKFDQMPTDLSRSIKKKHSKYKDRTEAGPTAEQEIIQEAQATGSVLIDVPITLAGFCEQIERSTSQAIMALMKMGIMANINQNLDEETAVLLGMELGVSVMVNHNEEIEEEEGIDRSADRESDLVPRAPIVTVMGHVDHGKTSLLDAIRNTNVTAGEAGGITQHIGASEIDVNGQHIVFLDTPGHEAFTAMRARGAYITDIAVLVVAADDSVMPQTIESISHAKAAGVPIIVAINKMDKPNANPELVKADLANNGVLVEDWGGDTICVPVSAKTGMGIQNLLEMILMQAEMLELKANPNRLAMGTVIEARLDKTRGPVATLLVTNGTLHTGSAIVAGIASGRVRVMTNPKGVVIKKAGPSRAVEITGLTDVPEAGDEFFMVKDEKTAREISEKRKLKLREDVMAKSSAVSLEKLFSQLSEGEVKDLNLIVKADVMGSVGALEQSLEKLHNENVRVRIIHTGVGAINESDVMLASTSNAVIIGFNVRPSSAVQAMADQEGVEIRTYRVIYEIIDDIEAAMKGMLDPEFKEVILGKIEVRETFKVSNVGTIAGSYVTEGKITRSAKLRLVRDGIVIHEGEIGSLRRFKDDVREVAQGFECGISIDKFNDIKVGDIIEAYTMEEVKRD